MLVSHSQTLYQTAYSGKGSGDMSTPKPYSLQKLCSNRSSGKKISYDYTSAAVSINEYHFIVEGECYSLCTLEFLEGYDAFGVSSYWLGEKPLLVCHLILTISGVKKSSIVIVVPPLVAIMEDQVCYTWSCGV